MLEGDPLLLAAQLAREQNEDAWRRSRAPSWRIGSERSLASQLRFWAALVEPDGMLIGKQLDMKLRTELSGITPLWRPWPNGLWLLDVKHVLPTGSLESSTPILTSNEALPEIRRELPEIPAVDGRKPQDLTPEDRARN